MSQSNWRRVSREVIDRVVAEHKANGGDLKKMIDAAYPFGQRQYHPYKIWLSERKAALKGTQWEPKKRPLSPEDQSRAAQQRRLYEEAMETK